MPLALYSVQPIARLSPRRRQILALIAEGYSNTAIAEHLALTRKSVENHINVLYRDLGLDPLDHRINPRVQVACAFLSRDLADAPAAAAWQRFAS